MLPGEQHVGGQVEGQEHGQGVTVKVQVREYRDLNLSNRHEIYFWILDIF